MKKNLPVHECTATPKPIVEYFDENDYSGDMREGSGWYVGIMGEDEHYKLQFLVRIHFCPHCGQNLDLELLPQNTNPTTTRINALEL